MTWERGETRYYIASACGGYKVSVGYCRGVATYTAWRIAPHPGQSVSLLYSRDADACRAACAADAERAAG